MAEFTPSTILVTFATTSDRLVQRILEEHDLIGNLVSPVICRWAIEVPYGQEDDFVKLFDDMSCVKHVSSDILKGREKKRPPRKKKRYGEEKRKF